MNYRAVRIRFFLLAATAWILATIFTGTGSTAAQDSNVKPRLRVLTYNIHHGEAMDGEFDYERLSKVIADLKPDVVGLQEVDCKTERSSGVDQAEVLGKRTKMNHVFGQAMPYRGGQYGEAVLSRFPIVKTENYPLPYRPGQEPRAALSVRIKPDNGMPELVFVVTHLCHQNGETRTWQARQINQVFPAKDGPPTILVGDLNARTDSAPMMELLAERWVDTVAPQSQIDYVLTRKGDPWRVIEVNIVEELVVSDHKPVLVVLEWTGDISTQPAPDSSVFDLQVKNGALRSVAEKVVPRFLDCGNPMNGFARIRYDECGHERLLAFSCRCRGYANQARRSEEWAAVRPSARGRASILICMPSSPGADGMLHGMIRTAPQGAGLHDRATELDAGTCIRE